MGFQQPDVRLPVVGALYLVLPRSASNPLLVVASLVFYGWGEPGALVLVGLSVAVNFRLGLLLETADGRRRRRLITAAVALNLVVLIVFKYAAFLVQDVNALVGAVSTYRLPEPRISLRLGISFFTFHLISYLSSTSSVGWCRPSAPWPPSRSKSSTSRS